MEEYLTKLKDAQVLIQDTIDKINNDRIQKELEDESDQYEFETEKEFRERFNDADAWEPVEQDNTIGVMEYASMCVGDDCWYKGNSDRLDSCEIKRMIGVPDLLLCNMCIDNERNMENHIEKYANEYKHNKKLKQKAEAIINKIGLTEFKVSWHEDKLGTVQIDNQKQVKYSDWNDIVDVLPSLGYQVQEETIWHVSKKQKQT